MEMPGRLRATINPAPSSRKYGPTWLSVSPRLYQSLLVTRNGLNTDRDCPVTLGQFTRTMTTPLIATIPVHNHTHEGNVARRSRCFTAVHATIAPAATAAITVMSVLVDAA